jgi:hypothetical protein
MIMPLRRWITVLAVCCLALAGAVQPVGAKSQSGPQTDGSAPVRGWTILSDSDRGVIRDAVEADKYFTRISQGWDRYDFIAVPRPKTER